MNVTTVCLSLWWLVPVPSPNGNMQLCEGLLFPPVVVATAVQRATRPQSGHRIERILKCVLGRAGITGPHAHAHAFRKGVVTELLRSGNPLKTVSLFVHHKNTVVTEQAYDKRSTEELLNGMVVPLGWEALSADIAAAKCEEMIPGADNEGTSTRTNTADQEQLIYGSKILEASEYIVQLKKKMSLLDGLLTPEQRQQFEEVCASEGLLTCF